MARTGGNIFKVARECGVRLYDGRQHSPTSRRPFDCFCKATVRDICRHHGEDHLRLVLQLLTGTSGNADELYSDTIRAVSHLLIRMPELERRSTLVSDFDRIDIGAMRQRVKTMRLGIEAWKHMASLIAEELYPTGAVAA
jgi:hypothetical protein